MSLQSRVGQPRKLRPGPGFTNKVLREHARAPVSHADRGGCSAPAAELGGCDRGYVCALQAQPLTVAPEKNVAPGETHSLCFESDLGTSVPSHLPL